VVVQLSVDAFFVLMTLRGNPTLSVHMSRTYVTMRIDSLFMEVLGVAVFVPNAIWPGQYLHGSLVIFGDFFAVKLAFSIKAVLFDVAPLEASHHAINSGHMRRLGFFLVAFTLLVALCMFGAGVPLIIASAGINGISSREHFSQSLVASAAALFWLSSAAMKFLHRYDTNKKIHEKKVMLQGIGALVCLLPFVVSMSDLHCLALVVAVAQYMENAQFRPVEQDDENGTAGPSGPVGLFSPELAKVRAEQAKVPTPAAGGQGRGADRALLLSLLEAETTPTSP